MAGLEFVERRSDGDNEFLEDIRCTISCVCLDDSSLSQGKELFRWRLVDSQGGKWYWGTKSFDHVLHYHIRIVNSTQSFCNSCRGQDVNTSGVA